MSEDGSRQTAESAHDHGNCELCEFIDQQFTTLEDDYKVAQQAREYLRGQIADLTAKLAAQAKELEEARTDAERMQRGIDYAQTFRTLAEYHEDRGSVLWWILPVREPPYCGKPDDDEWPGYHTHWTPLIVPEPEFVDAALATPTDQYNDN